MKSLMKINMVAELEYVRYFTKKESKEPMAELTVLSYFSTKNGELRNRFKILVFNPFVDLLKKTNVEPGDILNISCHLRNRIAENPESLQIILSGPDSTLIVSSKKNTSNEELHHL